MQKCISLSASVVILCVCGWLFADAQSAVSQAVSPEANAAASSDRESAEAKKQAASIVESDPADPTASEDEDAQANESEKASAPEYRYSLGLLISDVPDVLRAHANVPEDEGVLVQSVNSESPASKAGIKDYDILLKIDGQPIKDTAMLQQTVQKSAGKEITLTVLTKGQSKEIKVTPNKVEIPRMYGWGYPGYHDPQFNQQKPYNPGAAEDYQNEWYQRAMEWQQRQFEEMRQRMEALEQAMPGFGTFRVPRRGGIMPPQNPAFAPQKFSADPLNGQSQSFSYSVEKVNDQPAKIHINDNGKEYTVDENSLDQLPADVRSRINFKSGNGSIRIQTGTPQVKVQINGGSADQTDEENANGAKAESKSDVKEKSVSSDSSSNVQIKDVIDLK